MVTRHGNAAGGKSAVPWDWHSLRADGKSTKLQGGPPDDFQRPVIERRQALTEAPSQPRLVALAGNL
jgi:hypothetical protein